MVLVVLRLESLNKVIILLFHSLENAQVFPKSTR